VLFTLQTLKHQEKNNKNEKSVGPKTLIGSKITLTKAGIKIKTSSYTRQNWAITSRFNRLFYYRETINQVFYYPIIDNQLFFNYQGKYFEIFLQIVQRIVKT